MSIFKTLALDNFTSSVFKEPSVGLHRVDPGADQLFGARIALGEQSSESSLLVRAVIVSVEEAALATEESGISNGDGGGGVEIVRHKGSSTVALIGSNSDVFVGSSEDSDSSIVFQFFNFGHMVDDELDI